MAEVDLSTLAVRVKPEGIEQTTKQLGDLGKTAGETETRTEGLSESTGRLVAKYVSFAAIAGTAAVALRASVAQYAELQRATVDLSAKTGIAGAALDVMVDRAKALSLATTQSAVAILDATEQVEGMLPGLDGNAEAIAEVTRQAVILAEANGDELEPSVVALTQALQQFGGGAAEAARYANALVQAGNVGAASVQDLAAAMERVGPAADRAGTSFEQTLAAIELLANRGIKGREAVGGLKEFLDALATSTDERYSPALLGLDKVLENLAAENLTAAERTKLFGETAADVAAVVIANRAEFENLTTQITGTTAASDQAAQRMETLESLSQRLQNTVALLGTEVGERLNPYLVDLYDALGDSADAFLKVLEMESKTQEKSQALGEAIRYLTLWGVALGNTFFAVTETATKLTEAVFSMFDGINQGSENARTNLLGIFREWEVQMAGVADRVTAARDRLFDPQQQPAGELTRDAAPGVATGTEDAREDRERQAEERRAAARREAASAELDERQKFSTQLVDYLRKESDDSLEELTKRGQRELELSVEANIAKWQAKLEIEERIANDAEARQGLLAERMKEWFQTDLEATLELYDEREAQINEYFDSVTLPNEAERARRLAQVHEQRERAIDQLVRTGAIKRNEFEKLSAAQKTQFVLGAAEAMTAGLAQHNKAAFQLNKIAGIASATISTYQAAAKALAEGGPFAGPVLAATITAQGLAQVAAIKATQFEGGGGGTTPSLAGYGGVVNGIPAGLDAAPTPQIQGTQQGAGSETRIFIVGAGATMTETDVLDLLRRVKELADQNDVNLFSWNSRQAQDIVAGLR